MASIRQKNNRFQVQIRKKGTDLSATFSKKEDAELWAAWKEDILEQMDSFDPPKEELVRFSEAIYLKHTQLLSENKRDRSAEDVLTCRNIFKEFLDLNFHEITYQDWVDKVDRMLAEKVFRGGGRDNNSGRPVLQSPATVLRKLRVVASIYSHMISLGLNIENHPQKVISILKNKFVN